MIRTRALWAAAPIGAAAALIVSSGCGGAADDAANVVKIGVAGPLEQGLGAHTLRGAELARDQINDGGGIRGRTLELAAMSDAGDPQRAVAVAESLLADAAVFAVLGHSNSGATLAAAPIYGQGLAAVSATATSPAVTEAGPWIFRVSPSDAATSASMAEYALREFGSRTAVLYANDAFGRGLREAFGTAYVNGGGTLLSEYPYIEGQTEDFEPYLMGVEAARPDLIFVAGLDFGAARIIRQARGMGIETPILGGDGLLGLVGQDPIFDGTYVLVFYHPDAEGEANRAFVDAHRSAYGTEPDAYAALAYDAVRLLAQAAGEVGFDRQKVREYLEGVGNGRDPFPGVSGRIAFDEAGDPVEKGVAIGRIRGNTIELVSIEGGT
ncbi:MAG TPA: ABC transporter substrate-binding protein [Gemmatimonadota bacterium]|nr:ABC transporter substrate-binding protein [Gemmatimonadota bacterium]